MQEASSRERHLAKTFTATVGEKQRRIGSSFYRGDIANYFPNRRDIGQPTAIPQFILKGWMPEQPFIDQKTNIVAFGSCFAANIGRYLANIGFDVATRREGTAYIQRISDGLVNVHAICQQFEWAWENRVPGVELWHGWKAEDYGYDEEVRLATKALFDAADVFILTFGLSEIWYDEPTGEVFWRAVPQDKFDPSRHKFRVATYEETIERMRRVYGLIRKYRPQAKIIFTLSPVGLAATFRPVACITANSVSKALLRSAIDQLYRDVHSADPDFYYFPSYEVVTAGFSQPFGSDLRHPAVPVLNCNMRAFERYFCTTGLTDEDLRVTIADALKTDSLLADAKPGERRALVESAVDAWKEKKGLRSVDKQLIRDKRLKERQGKIAGRAGAADRGDDEARQAERAAIRAERAQRRALSGSETEPRPRVAPVAADRKQTPEGRGAGQTGRVAKLAERTAEREARQAAQSERLAERIARLEARAKRSAGT
jgi:hypothetical protein